MKHGFRLRRVRPVQILLYLFLRVVVMVVGMFPFTMAPRLSRFLGRLLRLVDRKHARIAAKNLEASPGVCPGGEIPAFVDRVYRNLALSFIEMLMLPRLLGVRGLSRIVRLERFDILDRLLAEGRGAIAVIGHQGNWELIGLGVTLAGYPLHSLARPVENPWIERYLERFRTQTGQRIISKYQALGEMIRVLRRNEVLVVQVDQDARHFGVFVDFFGRPASTHRSPAVLALKYGAPIVPVDIYREGGVHYCVLGDPLRPEEFRGLPDPVRALTQAYTARLEANIRRRPDQWFWVHDRWKSAERAARDHPEVLQRRYASGAIAEASPKGSP